MIISISIYNKKTRIITVDRKLLQVIIFMISKSDAQSGINFIDLSAIIQNPFLVNYPYHIAASSRGAEVIQAYYLNRFVP